jgi:hypothetical protein
MGAIMSDEFDFDDFIEDDAPTPSLESTSSTSSTASSESITSSQPKYWDSDEALEALKMERAVNTDETNEQLTRRILEESGPAAAYSIVHIALHGTNENTRLRASQYVTDFVTGDDSSSNRQTWEDLVGDVVSKAELFANANTEGSEQ